MAGVLLRVCLWCVRGAAAKVRFAVGLVDVFGGALATTLCSDASGIDGLDILGGGMGRSSTMAYSCVAIFRRRRLRFDLSILGIDSNSSSATASTCCVGFNVGKLQCCGKNLTDPLTRMALVSGQYNL